jgi:hypothetical protein
MSLVKKLVSSGVLVTATALITASVVSGGDPKPADGGAMPEMTPEMQKMMESWGAYMTPGKEHTEMAKYAGKWDVKTRMRFGPNESWQDGGGTAEFKTVMGGRYMFEKMTSPPDAMMPEGFEGFNIAGYDNYKKKYVFCWIDSAGTGFMVGEGDSKDGGKTISYNAECPDFMGKGMKKIRFIINHVDDNTIKSEMHETGADGKEYQSFGATYTRAK